MPSFVFGLADLIAGTVAAVKVDAYQPNETGEWMEVDSVQIVDLPANPDNAAEYLWTTELVDPALAVRFAPVSAAGVHLTQGGIILPPQPTEPGMFTVYANTYTVGLGIVPNVHFSAAAPPGATNGNGTIVAIAGTKTDEEGMASLLLRADVGIITLKLGTLWRSVNSADLAGKQVYFSALQAI
jgi:hypothetical protein